ncbi:putative serine/threonine-protein kinase SIS8 isoform X1 [Nicotiana tabacum]|uniref:non-specific serine/threonine protein kinase n=2 Tax=Nicotiana TaxID=4085 RepID=A0A1S4A5M9_TOBAC|nr:PREDICTED: serine/threonine-protein kinase EDR1-like isoform X1 [Nicotiana sylvestris]XP_016471904.1 PREDICTED: serine/threonine-protein kinase EDR1-like isoform X1 [Nicotiana tabacum]
MKNLLKKLHLVPNESVDSEGSTSSAKTKRLSDVSFPDNKPFSAISGWLNSVTNRHNSPSPPSSSNVSRGNNNRMEPCDSASSSGLDAALDSVRRDSESSNSREPDIEEEYQIQLALELSAKEDPEAVQIEAVKQISLGSCAPENTPAEIVAYRYWNYNALSFDDEILDGFYDLYGIMTESNSSKMPSLVDLQRTPVSDQIAWEAILVNRAADSKLLMLEQKALEISVKVRSESIGFTGGNLVQTLAMLVSEHMGGRVGDPESMLVAWRSLSYNLKATFGSMVLPLGSLTIGLARHRALLFKVLADCVGLPCRLVKGQEYTGSDEVAMNYVKIEDGREYIVDLMADPGTLIPSDTSGTQVDYEESILSISPSYKDVDSHMGSSSSGVACSSEDHSEYGTAERRSRFRESSTENASPSSSNNSEKQIKAEKGCNNSSKEFTKLRTVKKGQRQETSPGTGHARSPYTHARSPSWTEGVSSPAVRRMKVKDVSQYMIDAAKENPQLAQKLHDVLLESGVVAPPNLFTEVYTEELDVSPVEGKSGPEDMESKGSDEIEKNKSQADLDRNSFLPPLPYHGMSKANPLRPFDPHLDGGEVSGHQVSPHSELAAVKFTKSMPVAAAAAAAAAVVASSMVVAAAKTTYGSKADLPVAAAVTATAAAVVATTAAVTKQYENLEPSAHSPDSPAFFLNLIDSGRVDGDADGAVYEQRGSGDQVHEALGVNSESERISDRSTSNDSVKSDVTLDDVADCEIPFEDITLGERIGLGSYGEVYRGDWHGTEVAVKKFIDQDITGESLEEFKSEVRIMKRLRHPNVVLFMGAVTRPPNLSIITEFLHRGSLYRLIHRSNNQLDERRRLRMALDAARGMNYLHNCTPMVVHRDLKSPNLLVDKNWVVKVCDFGLSRMKQSTFLSSRSTAGTAEWMAPEVLRNEPSDEKCDVYSYGVVLWELCTLQQPWGGMNPMQVVGAVGFQHRRLDIPDDMDPAIADIIRKCWQTDPKLRPSFAEIMAALKPLQKPITSSQVMKPLGNRGQEKDRS